STVPVVRLAFTASTTTDDVADEVIAAFDAIDTSVISRQQREAGLEAIRFALADPELVDAPLDGLEFRPDARKNLILATDEDSDGPWNGGNYEAPSSFDEDSIWQDEINRTAALVAASDAFLDLLIEPADGASL